MPNLRDLAEIVPIQVWDGVIARRLDGEELTLAVVELEPNALVAEHRHAAEQFGLVIEGEMHFRIDDETRVLGPGGTWRILGDRPHEVRAGAEGAVVVDVFSPPRRDWDAKPVVGSTDYPQPPIWPRSR